MYSFNNRFIDSLTAGYACGLYAIYHCTSTIVMFSPATSTSDSNALFI